jgi:hypothetical protein
MSARPQARATVLSWGADNVPAVVEGGFQDPPSRRAKPASLPERPRRDEPGRDTTEDAWT